MARASHVKRACAGVVASATRAATTVTDQSRISAEPARIRLAIERIVRRWSRFLSDRVSTTGSPPRTTDLACPARGGSRAARRPTTRSRPLQRRAHTDTRLGADGDWAETALG